MTQLTTSLPTDSNRVTHPFKLKLTGPPTSGVFRVGRRHQSVFSAIPWEYTGTGRYDDMLAIDQHTNPAIIPFRVIYTATSLAGALVESMQRFRPGLDEIAAVGFVGGRELVPPTGSVPCSWSNGRVWAQSTLQATARLVDICAGESLTGLRSSAEMARIARQCGLRDIDLSAVTGPERRFTQACSRFIHGTPISDGSEVAGIRYVSRFGTDIEHECWAVFEDRLVMESDSGELAIPIDNLALIDALARLGLSVEE